MTQTLLPDDAHDQRLRSHVHPPDWVNPTPAARYNLVVIGGGTAGLVTAVGAAGIGARVALIERHLLGGDCLNYGCVPSKSLIAAARAAAACRDAARYGVVLNGPVQVDFAAVMERLRKIRADISPHDGAERLRKAGVDVFLGDGRFSSGESIEVAGRTLKFAKAVIATGARAAVPEIPGLKETGFFTNETIFTLTELPKRLAVIGGGPIGCELAQAFARLGSRVTLLHNKGHLLDREDADAAAIVQASLRRDGVELILGVKLEGATRSSGGKSIRHSGASAGTVECDAILVSTGRQPNVENLGLEAAGVRFDLRKGVEVDDRLRTSQPRIFACGDVCSGLKFTHAADFMARTVIQNALFKGRKKFRRVTIPWCTYTEPEIAQVGLSEHAARDGGIAVDTYVRQFADVDRAKTDGETEGFVKIITAKGKGTILGATIVGAHAGDLISEISVAMAGGLGLGSLAGVVHPYPTRAEAIRQCGDAYNRTRFTPFVAGLFRRWLTWTR